MQLRDLLTILGRRWGTLLICVLLVGGGTTLLTLRMTPVYQASARVYLSTAGAVLTNDDLATYAELVSSPIVLDPLRESLEIPPGTPIDVSANTVGDTPMMVVTARASDGQLAADIANSVGPELTEVGGAFARFGQGQGSLEVLEVAPAAAPGAPTSPNLTLNVLIGILAGLGLGIGVVLLQTFLDTKIRNEADLRAISTRPVLARLKKIRNPQTDSLVVEQLPFAPASEEFRRLRTNLQFIDVTAGGKHSFQVTSSVPGEGKTLTSVNLALAVAESGARVLLVDCDLRRPAVANMLGIPGSVGLTTLLLQRAGLSDTVQQWRDTSLYVLPAGELPPNPSELLASEAMQQLFTTFTRQFDVVIVDSPPVNPVIDPILINRLVGGTVMVVRVDRAGKRDLAQALRSLATVEQEVSGFALNGMPDDLGSYGHYYSKDYKKGGKASRKSKDTQQSGKQHSQDLQALIRAERPGGDTEAQPSQPAKSEHESRAAKRAHRSGADTHK